MFDNPHAGYLTIVTIAVMTTIVYGIVRLLRKMYERPTDEVVVTPGADAVSTPALPSGALEQREQFIRERMVLGLCLHCNARPEQEKPSLVSVRSWLDRIYLHLGVKAFDRWKVVVNHDATAQVHPALCAKHQERYRGLLEKQIAEVSAEYAEFADKQRRKVYEFEHFKLFDLVEADEQDMRQQLSVSKKKGGGKPTAATASNVVEIKKVANGGSRQEPQPS